MEAKAPIITNNGSPKMRDTISAMTTKIPVDISEPPVDLFHEDKR